MIWLVVLLALLVGTWKPRVMITVIKVVLFITMFAIAVTLVVAIPLLWAAWDRKQK